MDNQHRQEVRDGMMIEWDAPIAMDDGVVLRADIYRPVGEGKWPVILTYGPYAKGKTFADSRPFAWKHLVNKHPNVLRDSSNNYVSWDVVDPGRRLGYRIEGLPPVLRTVRNDWSLTAAGAGTDVAVTTTVDAGPRPPQQLVARLVARRMARASDSMLAGLAAHLTTGGTHVA